MGSVIPNNQTTTHPSQITKRSSTADATCHQIHIDLLEN
jgi:hypothetical protein